MRSTAAECVSGGLLREGTYLRVVTAICLAAVCAAVPLACLGAEAPAVVTAIEGGGGALLRGTSRYALAEGVRLQTGDIIELGDKGVAQIEFADGVILNLGPRTRFYAGAIVGRVQKGGVSDLYLMQGWSKIASGKAGVPSRYNTPIFGLGLMEMRTSGTRSERWSSGKCGRFPSAQVAALRSSGDFTLNLSMRIMSPSSITKSASDHAGDHCWLWHTA